MNPPFVFPKVSTHRPKRRVTYRHEYFDLAAAHTEKISDEFMTDAELVKKLPLSCQIIRDQKGSKESLDKLAEI